jgi:DNA-binding transcriptional ArsR family regulator
MDGDGVARLFAAVGDPTRLALLRFLLTQGAVSKQLATPADAGLLTRRRVGRRAYYTATRPDVVAAMLADAQTLDVSTEGTGGALPTPTSAGG